MLAVVLGTVGILCVPVGLFAALRLAVRITDRRAAPVRVAISVPQHATLTRVQPQTLDRPTRALTAGPDGVFR